MHVDQQILETALTLLDYLKNNLFSASMLTVILDSFKINISNVKHFLFLEMKFCVILDLKQMMVL